MQENKPFAKNRSGFRRSIGTFGAMLFGIHCISLSSSGYIPFSSVASSWPGANIVAVLLIAAVLSLLHGYCFAAIGAAIPRAGADYVLASRFVSPFWAFVSSWTFVLASAFVAGGLIAWIPKTAIPALVQPLAVIWQSEKCLKFVDWTSSFEGSLIIGLFCVLVTGASMFLPNRILLRVLGFGLLLGLVAWGIIFYVLYTAEGPSSFRAAWDHFVGSTSAFGAFDQRVPLARQTGMNMNSSVFAMSAAGLTMGFWIYYGYAIPTFFSGEVRESIRRNPLLVASAASIAVSCLIFVMAAVLLQRLVPAEWIAAEGFLSANSAEVQRAAHQSVPAYPWITFYAAILKPNMVLIVIVAIGWVYTLINLAQTYFFYISRIAFAWALDRRIPSVFAYQTSTGCPPACVAAIVVVASLGVLDASRSNPISTQLAFILFATVTQVLPIIALWKFPKMDPNQFRLLPTFVNRVRLGQPIIRWVTLGTLAYLGWIVFALFFLPAVKISRPLNILALLGVAGLGAIVFHAMRRYRIRKTGSPDDDVFRMMPPE